MKDQMFVSNIIGKVVSKDALKLRKEQIQSKSSKKWSRVYTATACGLVIMAFFCWMNWQSVKAASSLGDGQIISPQTNAGRLILTLFGSRALYAVNADPTDGPNRYDVVSSFEFTGANFPSVSQNGTIAFQKYQYGEGPTIWAMDADGSNLRQLTSWNAAFPSGDNWPVINAEGTKVAFIASRTLPTYPDGYYQDRQVFIVNTDGTDLHQVTPSRQPSIDDMGGVGGQGSRAVAVAWNGTELIVSGDIIVPGTGNQLPLVRKPGLFRAFVDGAEPIMVRPQVSDAGNFDVSSSAILFQVVLDDKIFILPRGEGAPIHTFTAAELGPISSNAGAARFSPDGSKIVYASSDENHCVRTINIDGTNRTTVVNNLGGSGNATFWMPGPPIPTPARLTLEPATMRLQNDGVTTRRVSPTLYDSNNNVIFHAAQIGFVCDSTHPCTVNPNIFTVTEDGRIRTTNPGAPIGYATFCGTSGGITGCSIVSVGTDVNYAEIRASVPSTNTGLDSGPAIFTVRRESSAPNSTFTVDFTVGGTAVRDLDYALNVTGNSIIIPAGQATFDLRVTPLRAAGNKTVTMSITAPPVSNYITTPGRDSASVNIVDNGPPPTNLSLSSITPSRGGNGGVVLSTVHGNNIAQGATVKLTRAGQPDITGVNVNVISSGRSLTTVFDLNGKDIGQWNVVVTNPNSTTAQITNGFIVEANTAERLTVQVSGAGSIRASHTRSRYDVVYTNHSNHDVFGVMLWVTGVARNQCATVEEANCTFIETPIDPLSSIPGAPSGPIWVDQIPNVVPTDLPNLNGPGVRQAGSIPIIIPRIPANSSGTFRFSMRFTSITQTELQQINAAILPPMVDVVTLDGPTGPTLAVVPSAASADEAFVKCLISGLSNALNCAIGLIPGEACVKNAIGALQTIVGLAINVAAGQPGAVNPLSGGQVIAAALTVGLTCNPIGLSAAEFIGLMSCLSNIYDTCSTCNIDCNPLHLFFVQSFDPNEKQGVTGRTSANYIPKGNLSYGISFENQPNATAPAQDVVITDQLDVSKVELSTFTLGQISFGDTTIAVPSGLTNYTTEVDLRPANDLLVSVSASLNTNTGLVTWNFNSLDPFTRQSPTNALAGFLPPNIIGMEGRGKVLFSIDSKNGVSDGTAINNQATIIFDLNSPINTNTWLNTIDSSLPVSGAQPLAPNQPSTSFNVAWTGSDTGSGVRDYSLYVSKNGGPFVVDEFFTSATSKLFAGEPDTTYAFYTIARDQAGNLEPGKTVAEAITHTAAAPGVAVTGTVTYGNAVSVPAPPRYVSNVLISGAGSPSVSVFTSAPGAGAGTYSLGGFGSGSYTVTPSKVGGTNNISSFDAALVSQHVAGPPLPHLTGNQLIVADVSGNGEITSFDAAEIAHYVVSSPPFGRTGTWKFNPISRTYASVTSNVSGEDYSALLMGEVSGDWTNTGARSPNGRRSAMGSGTEKSITVKAPNIMTIAGSGIVIPVEVKGAANNGIISYEFDLRYDPSVLQPEANPVDLSGTVSSGLSFAVNSSEPGILRVAVYGAVPIDVDGVLLNLKFTAIGKNGSTSRLNWTHMMFNEGGQRAMTTDGQIELFTSAVD